MYRENAVSDGMVRRLVENVHDEGWSGRPSFINNDMVQKVRKNRYPTISSLPNGFSQVSRSALYESTTDSSTTQWLENQAAYFYEEGVQKLVGRYAGVLIKCKFCKLKSKGSYKIVKKTSLIFFLYQNET